MIRVPVQPSVLRWAQERSRVDRDVLVRRFSYLPDWESGTVHPTLKQLEAYARSTFTPVGYFFHHEPPEEAIPIPDMRTIGDRQLTRPSANLLDSIYLCQGRQSWYRDHARVARLPAAPLVATATIKTPVEDAAAALRAELAFDVDERRRLGSWEEARRHFVAAAEGAGILVMISGVVGSNTRRTLDPDEFRGFALVDDIAPLIFVNGASSRSAQMFTLAHELAHLALGQSALSDADPGDVDDVDRGDSSRSAVERWCNQVAAELLVPMESFRAELTPEEPVARSMRRLSRSFKVSSLVVLRRLYEAGALSRAHFWEAYHAEVERLADLHLAGASDGGDFYATQAVRVSKRFASALIASTVEGSTLYRDALRLVGVKKVGTLHELGRQIGIDI
jgi:Zn-dependent peptidase ImmA (M78 family)